MWQANGNFKNRKICVENIALCALISNSIIYRMLDFYNTNMHVMCILHRPWNINKKILHTK